MAKSRILWRLELILCVMFYVFTDSYAGLMAVGNFIGASDC